MNGGRWNHKGIPCIYTSESRALAILEYTVNVGIDDIPRALSIITFEIPDQNLLIVPVLSLPGNWSDKPAPGSAKDFGSDLLLSKANLIIKIPSVIAPEEFNYVINPLHPRINDVRIVGVSDFPYDVRIKNR